MSKGAGSGDRLARGGIKATFPATDGGITQDAWSRAFDDYNPEEFKNAPNKSSIHSGDASLEEAGDAGAGLGATESGEPVTR